MHAVSASSSPTIVKSGTDMSAVRGGSASIDSQKVGACSMSGPHRTFSAIDRVFAPKTALHQYKPRNLGGKQKTAYEILRSDWSSDVCSSDLGFVNLGPYIDAMQ